MKPELAEGNFSLKSFDHLWATKLNLACLLMDKSIQKLITTIPIGTHQLLAGNHRLTGYGMSHNTTHLNYHTGSRRCVTASQPFPKLEFVIHVGQHFPYLRNLFEAKS